MSLLRYFVGFCTSGMIIPSQGTISVRQREVASVVFGVTLISMYPVDLCDGLIRFVMYDFCLRNFVEGMGPDHEVADSFDQVTNLYPNVME